MGLSTPEYSEEAIIEYCCLFMLSFCGLVSFAVTGMGDAIVFEMGYWTLVALGVIENASLANAVSYLTFSNIPVAMMQAVYYFPVIRQVPRYIFVFWVPCICSAFVGTEVLMNFDSDGFVRICGAVMLFSLAIIIVMSHYHEWCGESEGDQTGIGNATVIAEDSVSASMASAPVRAVDDDDSDPEASEPSKSASEYGAIEDGSISYVSLSEAANLDRSLTVTPSLYKLTSWQMFCEVIFTGSLSGLLGGMFGIYGPPIKVYVLARDVERQVVNGITAVLVGFGAGIAYIVDFFIIHDEFRDKQWLKYVVVFAGALFGLCAGNIMAPYVDQEGFRVALYVILFCGGIQLLLVGFKLATMIASCFLVLMIAGLVIYLFSQAVPQTNASQSYIIVRDDLPDLETEV